mgnify:CR=1 FL=1
MNRDNLDHIVICPWELNKNNFRSRKNVLEGLNLNVIQGVTEKNDDFPGRPKKKMLFRIINFEINIFSLM